MDETRLAAIEKAAEAALAYGDVQGYRELVANDVPELVGEVRRLQAFERAVRDAWNETQATIRDTA